MHHGTFRGSLSAHYEISRATEKVEGACEEQGLDVGKDIGVCDIGETVAVLDGSLQLLSYHCGFRMPSGLIII